MGVGEGVIGLCRTGCLLELEGLVLVVLLGDLLLGLLVVNWVGTRCGRVSFARGLVEAARRGTYIPFRKAFWRFVCVVGSECGRRGCISV